MSGRILITTVNGRRVTDPNAQQAIDALITRTKQLEHAIRFAMPVLERIRDVGLPAGVAVLDDVIADLRTALEPGGE